jgi:hypothetical protein
MFKKTVPMFSDTMCMSMENVSCPRVTIGTPRGTLPYPDSIIPCLIRLVHVQVHHVLRTSQVARHLSIHTFAMSMETFVMPRDTVSTSLEACNISMETSPCIQIILACESLISLLDIHLPCSGRLMSCLVRHLQYIIICMYY